MTRDEILKMEAGREMDAWIAEKVMGCNIAYEDDGKAYCNCKTALHCDSTSWGWIAHYSTNIADAWEVVEKFENESPCLVRTEEGWEFLVSKPYGCSAAATAPLAICRAALLAVLEVNNNV